MTDEIVVADNSNTAEVDAPNVSDTDEGEPTSEESIEEVKARLAKAEELANNYKIRAEKAEKGKKTQPAPEAKKGDLSSKDLIAIMNAKVPEDDIDEVVDYAKFKGISVGEALKSSTIKATLSERAEQRNTAAATNTGTVRRGNAKVSDDVLLSEAQKGKLPESDDDIARLIGARSKKRD